MSPILREVVSNNLRLNLLFGLIVSTLFSIFFFLAQSERQNDFVQGLSLITTAPASLASLPLVSEVIISTADLSVLDGFTTEAVRLQDDSTVLVYSAWWLCITSLSFWSFHLALIFISGFVYLKQCQELLLSTSEISHLECWANQAKVNGKAEKVSIKGIISSVIAELQQQIQDSSFLENRFDLELRESALLDPETRVGNRDFFNNHLAAFLKEEDSRGAVMIIHIKACDLVSNLYGQEQATELLQSVIKSVKVRLYGMEEAILSRRGDAELVVLLPNLYVKETEKFAERVLRNICSIPLPIGIRDEEFCHIGISCFTEGDKLYDVMSEADMALRSAQLQGPAQWFMYEPGELANVEAKGSLKWRTFLGQVINNNAFVIFFQPVIASNSDSILHLEVLTKIREQDGSLLSPRVFLPMVEKCGLSTKVDLLICEQVCRLLAYEKDSQERCSINLSIDSLKSSEFCDSFFSLMDLYPGIEQQLIIEISEYQLVTCHKELMPIIDKLHARGIKILADKVGQYVVSSEYLKRCHISFIKLHRNIVLDIHRKPDNQVFVQSMRVLCEPLGIAMYALGVEKLEEWQALSKIGIHGGQGHYFTEPVTQMAKAIGLP